MSPAQAKNHFPYLEGEVFSNFRTSFVNKEGSEGGYSERMEVVLEPKFSLNINSEWSVKGKLEIAPLEKTSLSNYELGNVLASDDRPHAINRYGIAIEELKGYFKGDDMAFFFGKYNPKFGEAWKKEKRIGIFTTDFTEDYQLKEKIGLGVEALLENEVAISVNSFFNDITALSNSAIYKRGSNDSGSNVAGNNTNLSSYSITVSGNNFFDIEDLRYSFGYRDLDVKKGEGYKNEKGILAGLEYSKPISYESYFVPFIEIARISNFRGIKGRDILYSTISASIKHSNWNIGATLVIRDVKQQNSTNHQDKQMQYFIGYKFKNNINLDVTHLDVKESGRTAKIFGVGTSYIYKF